VKSLMCANAEDNCVEIWGAGVGGEHTTVMPTRFEPSRVFLLGHEIPLHGFLRSSTLSLINSLFWCGCNRTDTIEGNGFAVSFKGDDIELRSDIGPLTKVVCSRN
jgi:hypothetical protein